MHKKQFQLNESFLRTVVHVIRPYGCTSDVRGRRRRRERERGRRRRKHGSCRCSGTRMVRRWTQVRREDIGGRGPAMVHRTASGRRMERHGLGEMGRVRRVWSPGIHPIVQVRVRMAIMVTSIVWWD